MKIKQAHYRDFGMIDEMTVNFSDNVTYLTGANGAGKSTAGLSGIQFVLQGIAQKSASKDQHPLTGERFRFLKGDASSAKGAVLLTDTQYDCDILVKRKITKTAQELTFEAPTGIQLDQDWLNSLFNEFCLSPESFCNLTGKEQAKALGIDLSEEETKLKSLKEDYTLIGRQIKEIGIPEEVEKVEAVKVDEIVRSRQEAQEFNDLQKQRADDLNNTREELLAIRESIRKLQEEEKQVIEEGKELPKPEPLQDLQQFDKQIAEASEINTAAMRYDTYLAETKKLKTYRAKQQENKESQGKLESVKTDKIKATKLPFKNLSVDEEGSLLLSGKPIKPPYFSTGELLMIIPTMLTHINPELKYIFLQDFNLLDEANQTKLVESLTKKGYQVVCELVGEKDGDNVIKLKSNKIEHV